MAIKSATAAVDLDGRGDSEVPVSADIIPRDRWRRPLIPLHSDPDGPRIPRTRSSGFGKYLEDAEGLAKWGQGIVAIGVGRSRPLQIEAAGLGTQDLEDRETKKNLARLRDEAFALGGGNDGWRKGNALHRLTEVIDEGKDPGDQGEYNAVLDRYRELTEPFEIVCSEVFGANDRWLTAGTFDFLLRLKGYMTTDDGTVLPPGTIIGGDKKTSGTARYFGAKFAVQLKTYFSGEPISKTTGRYIEWGEVGGRPDQRWALILHLPSDPRKLDDAGWYWVDLDAATALCDLSAAIRAAMRTKPITPVTKLPTMQHPDDMRRAGALSKIRAAKSVAALKMIHRSHRELWDDELQAAAVARKAEIVGEVEEASA